MHKLRNHLLTLGAGAGLIATAVGLRATIGVAATGLWWLLLLGLGTALVALEIMWWLWDIALWRRRRPWRGWTLRTPVALTSRPPVPAAPNRPPPYRPAREPGKAAYAHIVISAGTPETAVLGQGTLPPSAPEGDLPIRVDMDGFTGERKGEQRSDPWVWKASSVHLVNSSEQVLEFRAWFLPETARTKGPPQRDAKRLRLEPQRSRDADFEFLQHMGSWTEDERASPPDTVVRFDLVFLEIGTSRELRFRFTPARLRKQLPA